MSEHEQSLEEILEARHRPAADDRTVTAPGGERLSEAEFSNRGQLDAEHSADVLEAASEHERIGREAEDARAAEAPRRTRQIEVDTSNTIDRPGQSAGGTLVIRRSERNLEDVSRRRDREKADAESDHANREREAAAARKAEESADGDIVVEVDGEE